MRYPQFRARGLCVASGDGCKQNHALDNEHGTETQTEAGRPDRRRLPLTRRPRGRTRVPPSRLRDGAQACGRTTHSTARSRHTTRTRRDVAPG